MNFQDHFSKQADRYTQFRPHYPAELFRFLATLPARTERAWDCGTGNGQAAVVLAEFFDEVVATDPSAGQIEHACEHPRVRYQVAPAEAVPLADGSTDLVTVAQALHWFDHPRFYDEVRRVLRPAGAIAAWGYGLAVITPEVDAVVQHLYADLLGPYWPPERRKIEERYATIPFPFAEVPDPGFAMAAEWSLDDLLGYLGTWSSAAEVHRRARARSARAGPGGFDTPPGVPSPCDRCGGHCSCAWGGWSSHTATIPRACPPGSHAELPAARCVGKMKGMSTVEQTLAEGTRLHQAGRLAEAERAYRQVLATHPNHPHALHQLGMLAMQARQFDAAITLLRRALQVAPTQPAFHANLGEAYRHAGQPGPAAESYRRALELNPGLCRPTRL